MIYEICDKSMLVKISDLGAEIKAISINNKDYMHDANPLYWGRTAPYLFPNIGTIKDNYVIYENKKYKYSKHGFLRDTIMEMVNKTTNSITFELDGTSCEFFPFAYKLVITYTLIYPKLNVRIFVYNKDNKTMHFNFGLHPAFKVPWNENEKFEDYKIVFDHNINADTPTVILENGLIDWNKIYRKFDTKAIILNHEDYKNDAICIEPYPKGKITLQSPNNESIILYAPGFKTLGIWTPYPTKAPFICLEPWYGCADCPTTNHQLLTKKDLISIEPNEIWINNYSITINC